MSAGAALSPDSATLPAWRDPAKWARTADICAVLIALSLPWSTSLVGIFVVVWVIAVLPTLDPGAFLVSLKRPICILPIALFALTLVGTLWSDAAWGVRLYAVSPAAKLLALPLLLYHYQRSSRGMWVFTAFLISCSLLMVFSWVVALHPQFALKADAEYGVPVKNYIDQSQEFALCAVALAYPIINLLRAKKILPALLLSAIALSFIVNMAFVIVSRTALVTVPILLAVFALLHLRWRNIAIIACLAVVLAGLAWVASPQLRIDRRVVRQGLPIVQGTERSDIDGPADGVLEEIDAVFCRSSGVRPRHRFDARAVRTGRDRRQNQRYRSSHRQSA